MQWEISQLMCCVSVLQMDGWSCSSLPWITLEPFHLSREQNCSQGTTSLFIICVQRPFFFTACSVWIHREVSMCCGTISLLGGHNRDSINLIDRAAPSQEWFWQLQEQRELQTLGGESFLYLHQPLKAIFAQSIGGLTGRSVYNRDHSLDIVWTYKLWSSEACRRCIRYRIKTPLIFKLGVGRRE